MRYASSISVATAVALLLSFVAAAAHAISFDDVGKVLKDNRDLLRWHPITSASSFLTMQVDSDSITSSGDRIRAWVKTEFSWPRETGSVPFRSELSRFTISCANRTISRGQVYAYEGKNLLGNVVFSTPEPTQENPVEVVPGSPGEDVVRALCGGIAQEFKDWQKQQLELPKR